MDIDLSIEKPERNFQRAYTHIGVDGTHFESLPVQLMLDELDYALCYQSINEPEAFITLVYQIVCHQSYHVEIDELCQTTYNGISLMLDKGQGNPRLHKLENILNALGLSMAVCRVADRENDVPHSELQRACFFQHLIKKERWTFKDAVALLWSFGLQFRLFTVDDSQKLNTLNHTHDFDVSQMDDETFRKLMKSFYDITALLRMFNLLYHVALNVEPPEVMEAEE